MKDLCPVHPLWVALLLLPVIAPGGCSRSKYRIAADNEAYHTIAERNGDPRWNARDYSVNIDPRSRYFDQYNPDCPPMPKDDPASHQYMRSVNGMKGWKHWYDNGIRPQLENPSWVDSLAEYVDVDPDGTVKLDIDSALKLAYVHSPNHQSQLETLYLSSLDVTTERFRLSTQFFGGYDLAYAHQGSLSPPFITFNPTFNRYVLTPAIDGVESNLLSVGRPASANPALQVRRRFATAGEVLVGFANSFVFQFTGDDANLSASILNFSFVQPLLSGGGRDIALEQLTFFERTLLANLRSYSQFRQGFYTQVAIGEQGVSGPQRGGRGTNLQVFSGQGFLSGYVGLLQQQQRIRNAEDNLDLQLRTLAQLEALLDAGLIDLVQVDQFRQNVESDKASLLQTRNDYYRALDTFKTGTLGLPPNLPIELDDELIRQFQLVDRDITAVQDSIALLQARVGELPNDADLEVVRSIQVEIFELMDPLQQRLDAVQKDLAITKDAIPVRLRLITDPEDRLTFEQDIAQLDKGFSDLQEQFAELDETVQMMRDGDTPDAFPNQTADAVPVKGAGREATLEELAIRDTVVLLRDMLRVVQGATLVQARARLEAVSVDMIDLDSEDAFQIALTNRLDFMNGRASLVDDWRSIAVAADALQSALNVEGSGNMRTARNNPLSFRAPTSNVTLGLRFDAPFTRLLERNSYRESLINYQRSRRNFIQSRDSLHLGLRVLLRDIEQLRTNLEIQRRAVAIAIRRVDLTRSALYAPVAPPQPGQPPASFGPTAAIQLLSAQSALRDTQNSFLGAWLNYYAAKMRLARELGIMALDPEGRWIETPPPGAQNKENELDLQELPPPVELDLLDAVESLPDGFTFEAPDATAVAGPTIDNTGLIE